MGLQIGVWYEAQQEETAKNACTALREAFPNITFFMLEHLEVPAAAFDTAAGNYDVHYLLDHMVIPSHCDRVVWVVGKMIGDFWRARLFGAATGLRALVSTAVLREPELLAKETCHEVGHLLGLQHCADDCCMRSSATVDDVRRKPGGLCRLCCENCRER